MIKGRAFRPGVEINGLCRGEEDLRGPFPLDANSLKWMSHAGMTKSDSVSEELQGG